jgi:AraC-like DNA-binding protein
MVKEHQTIEFAPSLGCRSLPDMGPGVRVVRVDGGDGKRLGGMAAPVALAGLSRACSGTDQKVERTIHYMVANLNRPLRIATLAAQANVSPSHFFALFKQRIGCPPMDYFTKLRMGEACRLLDSTDASVKEVAAALGYDDPLYFSRVFKSFSAVAPMHYRSLGYSARQEIRNLLERPEQFGNGDGQRRAGASRVPVEGNSTPVSSTPPNYKTQNSA